MDNNNQPNAVPSLLDIKTQVYRYDSAKLMCNENSSDENKEAVGLEFMRLHDMAHQRVIGSNWVPQADIIVQAINQWAAAPGGINERLDRVEGRLDRLEERLAINFIVTQQWAKARHTNSLGFDRSSRLVTLVTRNNEPVTNFPRTVGAFWELRDDGIVNALMQAYQLPQRCYQTLTSRLNALANFCYINHPSQ